jgi:Mn-dependent DtxR family transcriptional regulator
METSQLQKIANLFDDRQVRTSKMVSNELGIKNSSTSRYITTLRLMGLIELVGNDICPISNYTAAFYKCVLWQKKGGYNG